MFMTILGAGIIGTTTGTEIIGDGITGMVLVGDLVGIIGMVQATIGVGIGAGIVLTIIIIGVGIITMDMLGITDTTIMEQEVEEVITMEIDLATEIR